MRPIFAQYLPIMGPMFAHIAQYSPINYVPHIRPIFAQNGPHIWPNIRPLWPSYSPNIRPIFAQHGTHIRAYMAQYSPIMGPIFAQYGPHSRPYMAHYGPHIRPYMAFAGPHIRPYSPIIDSKFGIEVEAVCGHKQAQIANVFFHGLRKNICIPHIVFVWDQ